MNNNVIIDESAKQILIENIYKGKGYTNTLDPVPVKTYAKMQVSDIDIIIPENIKGEDDRLEILGIKGTYAPMEFHFYNNYKTDWIKVGGDLI